ncbi:rho GTPase-activating protein 100F isoform X6 [Bombus vosnesenskii]|uniref:Rho GTPase-activating protein 100F isoform X6 n=2 Tax=Pyrobombus TaxID=144703 RepID=A0A6J3LKA3_9HYME|nr:rho GTPase-activating protein 100F isoform X6 [Bombus vancouverensis nearcticus]XP_033320161.1 rho GTPase-activating protein 100F isoform X6 [Bombus bifarius]XP_033365111.1 rho GTPase-activating protein 100F isoform X6 [Bombus vosnesenskii]XP_050492770.1 rho GTPase-activating protein 100F isoform X6 [Bombus huntii]
MDKRTIPRTTDLDTSRRRKEEQQRAWTPVETRERGAEGCTTKAEELLAAAAGLPEDTSNKRGCKSAAQVWMSLLSLCDRMCGSAAWLVLFTCLHGEGRGEVTDISASPGRQAPANQLRPKEPPPMVIQGDFRKVSGISTEIFKQIETVENDHDASTAAALEAVERRGEMVVRVIEPRQMGRQASEAAKKFIAMQDPKHPIHFVEIIKRPGQTLGLYIREGNGVDRNDGVFISRIALETAVYNSGCLKVGDEILAVNLVDVTHMSLDDVVIIMSIPRRLVLATRHGQHQPVSHSRQTEHKAPPVVVIKRELNEDESDHATSNHVRDGSRRRGDGREMLPSRSRLGLSGLGSSQDLGSSNGDLYYNSRPEGHWSYQPPPPPVITHQPKPSTTQHFQPYERGYPKTLESLAEKDFTKVHSFYTGPVMPSNGGRRMSTGAGMQSVGSRLSSQTQPSHYGYGQHSGSGRIMPRSGSDQHLPRVDYTSITTPARHTLLRSSLKSGTSALRYNTRYGTQGDSTSTTQRQGQFGTLTRRHRPSLDYASDTEATCSSSPKSAYYYYRHNMNNPPQSSAVSHLATLSRSQIGQSSSGRIPSSPSVFTSDEYRAWLSRTPSTSALYEQIRATTTRPPRYTYSAENIHAAVNQGEYGSYGTYRPLSSTLDRLSTRSASAQQVNLANLRASTAISSTCHRGTANPRPASVASSARTSLTSQKPSLSSSTTQRATSVRRIRNLLDLESTRSIPTPTPTRTQDQRLLDINPAEFLKYKIEKPPTVGTPSSTSSLLSSLGETSSGDLAGGVSGLLWVHLLAGRGLRSTTSSSAATTPSTPSGQPNLASCGLRDLYCVLECDRVHKARTVMRTGDLMFDWDETFELDLVGNRQLDLLVYSWDPQYRHKLCYKGSVHLATLLKESPVHQLAVKVEPRGTIYLRLRYTDAQQTFRRRGLPVISLATRVAPLFGVDLDTVVSRESKTGGVPGGVSTALAMGVPNVPIIVWRCVEEVERRGLDIIGLYRLCGSATKKRILREAFERNARSVNLSPDNVPDINVITGVLKDYLRELPEPLFTRCLYQMMVDALAVCLPDDPQGNAKLMFSILDCLPKVNRCTLIYLLDHLAMVVSQCNKMSPASLAVCFGPVLMLHSEENGPPLDFQQPIAVLKYLLEIWPVKSVRKISSVASALPRVTPTVEHNSSQQQLQHQQQAQQQVQQQLQGTLGRTGLPWQPQHSLHQQPPTTAAPAALAPSTRPPPPVKPRQVIVSSPGSPSSEESEASPEPINKSLLGGLGLEKNNEGATANSTGPGTEQITPTSSVDTEEGNTPHPEEGEKGVEGDAEASDDDRH